MNVRRLDQCEHGKTRPLWEEVFTEDTQAFLDYYYYIKTKDNQIYVIEEDEQICSMLQLNPYRLKVEESEFPSAYIIAVATKEAYRGRGFMGALLRRALNDMYEEKIPFTFLMPAAEAIYTPYDFRFIYSQCIGSVDPRVSNVKIWEDEDQQFSFTDAALWNAEEMADFFNRYFAPKWQVYAVRDAAYYQTMIMEQQSERGGVRLMRCNGELAGFYAYAAEDGLEIREPLYLDGYEQAFLHSAYELAASVDKINADKNEDGIKIFACPAHMADEKKPVIMARIICLRELLKAMRVHEEEELDCSFAVIDPIIHENSRVWRITSQAGEEQLNVRETEDSEGILPVDVLTEFLFGRVDAVELSGMEGVVMAEHLIKELQKIKKLTKIFLNEVV